MRDKKIEELRMRRSSRIELGQRCRFVAAEFAARPTAGSKRLQILQGRLAAFVAQDRDESSNGSTCDRRYSRMSYSLILY